MAFLTKSRRPSARWNRQAGQTMILVVVVLGIFLLGFIGFAVDYSNMWFHRQMAQSAADAACQAGAMDMLSLATGGTPSPGMTMGTDLLSCPNPAVVPPTSPPHTACWYAARNNYRGYGVVANTESNNVSVRYISSVPGVSNDAGYNFLRVDVLDRVRTYFSVLLTGNQTQDVVATAKCGLVLSTAPIPIVVLHPTNPSSFDISGNPTVRVFGGPQKSLQVNSQCCTSVGSVALNIGGQAKLDLSQGGPNYTGSDAGVYGTPHTQAACGMSNCWIPGSTSHWVQPSSPLSDPLAQVPAPSLGTPGTCFNGGISHACSETVSYGATADATHDPMCMVGPTNSTQCTRYYPGFYSGQLNLSHQNALFVPGVYYMTGTHPNDGLYMGTQSVARPSALPGDGNDGAMFYFSGGGATLSVGSLSGLGNVDPASDSSPACPYATSPPAVGTICPYDPYLSPVTVQCPSGPPPNPPISGELTGNVFLGPCSGTYGFNGYRGMVFFGDRNYAVNAQMAGHGSYLIAGNIYFHQYPPAWGSSFSLVGQSGNNTQLLGEIIVDQLNLGGGGYINMQLNSLFVQPILKVQLLQ